MALPTIAIHASGSNVAASGAGPTIPLAGTGAALATSTAVNLSVDAPNLAGVAVDGSAALWVASSTGRQWSKITAINNSTKIVTVETAYTVTESGRNWGIGGKRATLAGSLQLGLDIRGGWTIDIQDNQTLTANFRVAANAVSGVTTTLTSTTATRPVISTATNNVFGVDLQGANNLTISHLSFLCTATTKGNGIGLATGAGPSNVIVSDCLIDGFNVGIRDHDNGGNTDVLNLFIDSCEIKNCSFGVYLWAGAEVSNCYLHHNTSNGIFVTGARQKTTNLFRCICDSNGMDQVSIAPSGNSGIYIDQCNFTNAPATRYGLNLSTGGGSNCLVLKNSIFHGNATGGINVINGNSLVQMLRNNAFGANGVNVANMITSTGLNPITLTANPFTSATDFTPNAVAGGGALLKGAGVLPLSGTTAPDVGAVQSSGGGGGGGPVNFAY